MSAQINSSSEDLVKLQLFLEKQRSVFKKDNLDILDWLQDRNLEIDKLGLEKNSENQIATKVDPVEKHVLEELVENSKKNNQLESEITLEEYQSIFEKLTDLLELPAGQLEDQSELYLEQQLSDLLGFDVLAEIDGNRLNHMTGTMGIEPHLKRHPNDKLSDHSNVFEAGMSNYRGAFGWFVSHGELTKKAESYEKYYFSLQLYQLENWSLNYKELKNWYKFRKMIVINPAEKIAVVGVVGNIDQKNQLKKQFGASPEIIREGMIWSPKTQGKVLIMFVDDQEDSIPLGPIYMKDMFKIE